MVRTLEIQPLQVKLELFHLVLHLEHTPHTTACKWVMFGDIMSFQVLDQHQSSSEHKKDIYCLYMTPESIHECCVITLQSRNADTFDSAAITATLL